MYNFFFLISHIFANAFALYILQLQLLREFYVCNIVIGTLIDSRSSLIPYNSIKYNFLFSQRLIEQSKNATQKQH